MKSMAGGLPAQPGPARSADWTAGMWWIYIVVLALFAAAIYGFASLVGFRTRWLTSKTARTAENMYRSYADSPAKQRRYARRHGGEWRSDDSATEPGSPAEAGNGDSASRPPG